MIQDLKSYCLFASLIPNHKWSNGRSSCSLSLMKRFDPGEPQYWLLLILVAKFTLCYPNVHCSGSLTHGLEKVDECKWRQQPYRPVTNMGQHLASSIKAKYVKKLLLQTFVSGEAVTAEFTRTCHAQTIWVKFEAWWGLTRWRMLLQLFCSHDAVKALTEGSCHGSTGGGNSLELSHPPSAEILVGQAVQGELCLPLLGLQRQTHTRPKS